MNSWKQVYDVMFAVQRAIGHVYRIGGIDSNVTFRNNYPVSK